MQRFDQEQRAAREAQEALVADYISGACDAARMEQLAQAVETDSEFAALVGRQLALHRVLNSLKPTTRGNVANRVLESVAPAKEAVEQLMAAYVAGQMSAHDRERLALHCEQDPAFAAEVARHLQLDRVLRAVNGQEINADLVMHALPHRRDSSLTTRVLEQIERNDHRRRWRLAVPVAAAAAILLALLLGLMLSVQPAPTVKAPATPVLSAKPTEVEIIKQSFPIIRSGPTAQWPNNTRPYAENGQLVETRVNLCAGIAELEMPSGATLILQGPTLLDITGENSVRLLLGRATTYVPPRAVGFSLQAEGVEIIDLGTSFGISQGIDGIADVHVFTGQVVAVASIEGLDERKHLFSNEAMRIDPRGGKWQMVPCDSSRFVFSLRPQRVAIDMADIIAGGDGSGSGVADGIDPKNGKFITSSAKGYSKSDMEYHVTGEQLFVDGAFIPNGAKGENIISSSGHSYKFPETEGISYDIIRRGGTYDIQRFVSDKQQPGIPPVFAGIDYRLPGHSAIGMHSNVGFTIDLHAIAYQHTGMRVVQFTTTVANVGQKGSYGKGDFWVLIDGKLITHDQNLSAKTPPRAISVAISQKDRYLTLVSTDGGNGMGLDWITLGDPRLLLGEALADGPK